MSETRIIKPQPISGFPEWLPEEKLVEDRILRVIREEFERYGFTPIETAAVERREILTAKGIVEKEIYGLSRLAAGAGEDPATDLALHFDLTVPTARYVAQNAARLTFPFRRYQIQKVWRGERPQAGRFRELYQADIDVIGNGTLSLLNDAEIPCVINAIFARIGIGEFVIRINNRKLLQGYLLDQGLTADGVGAGLKVIDAIEKAGRERTLADLAAQAGIDAATAERIVALVTRPVTIDDLRAIEGGDLTREGLDELGQVVDGLVAFGVPAHRWRIDLAVVRGLDYYTGTVYETQLVANPEVGSICSGGRYEDLASNYTRQKLPGVGISIGVSRLLWSLFDAGLLKPGAATPAQVLVTVLDRTRLPYYLGLATALRAGGIATELFTEAKRVGDQLKYAGKKGFRLAVIAGETEIAAGSAVVKNLASGEQATHPQAGLVEAVRRVLAG